MDFPNEVPSIQTMTNALTCNEKIKYIVPSLQEIAGAELLNSGDIPKEYLKVLFKFDFPVHTLQVHRWYRKGFQGNITSNVPVPFNKAINNPSVVAVLPWHRDEICQYKFDVEQRRIRSVKRKLQF